MGRRALRTRMRKGEMRGLIIRLCWFIKYGYEYWLAFVRYTKISLEKKINRTYILIFV
jgi:hypothetical protein